MTPRHPATTTHDRPQEYGCAPEHYAPPRTPEWWTLVATHNPPEPYGWRGACRVVLHLRDHTAREPYAVHVVTPTGALAFGTYHDDPLDAFRWFAARAADEDKRAARYIAAIEREDA